MHYAAVLGAAVLAALVVYVPTRLWWGKQHEALAAVVGVAAGMVTYLALASSW